MITQNTRNRVRALFSPEEWADVEEMLDTRCGNSLPFLENLSPERLERFQFAALKLSEGDLAKLEEAVAVAQRDWRDLLVAAGFGNSLTIHKRWFPSSRTE